ncbi:MAG TPA: peptidylprolyl isomerase [Bryobacteraceae bacterium]|nr:peptidylprolyl isomerase [Bryobacteraceae bacterium]
MKLFVLFAASAVLACAQAPRVLPINTLPPDTVVAKADGKPITAGEIRTLLEVGDPSAINLAKMDPERFLGSVFVMRFLASEADKAHLADESPLKEELQYLRERVVANAMVNRIRENYYPPSEDIEAFYAKNSSRYEQAFIKAIVIGFCPPIAQPAGTSDEELARLAKEAFSAAHCESKHTEADAKAIAAKVVARLRAGDDFVKLVDEYSEDKESKPAGGDFPLVTRTSSYSNEIKSAVFSLKNGEVSEPIRSGNFFYIIKIRERTVQPLTAVSEPIIQELKQKHFTDWMQEIGIRFKPVIERPDFFIKPDQKPAGPPQLVPQP